MCELVSSDHDALAIGGFSLANGAARARFAEAVAVQTANPDYRHFLSERHPDAPDPLALFTLAESYDLVLAGRADIIKVGMPLKHPDIKHPELRVFDDDKGERPYFLLEYWQGSDIASLVLSEENFDEKFGSPEPPVADLVPKLLGYELIPNRKG